MRQFPIGRSLRLYILCTVKFISRRDTQSHAEKSPFYIFYIFYTVNIVRAAGDCRPYRWTAHGPQFYILYIFYTVNYPAPLHVLLISTAIPDRLPISAFSASLRELFYPPLHSLHG